MIIPGLRRVAAALLLTIAAVPALAQKRPVSSLRVGSEVVAGTVAIPVGLLAGLIVGSGFGIDANSNIALAGAGVGAIAGPPLAVMAVGSGGPSRGKFLPTLGGATVGYAATAGILLYGRSHKGRFQSLATKASFFLPAIGATIAYNRSRP